MMKKEIVGLLAESKSKLHLHLKGRFDIGIKANRAWGYQPGITIDWIVKPEVQRNVLAKVFSTMTPGSKSATVIPEATPSPVTAPPIPKKTLSLDATRKITIYFASGSTSLDDDAKGTLRKWAEKQRDMSKDMCIHIEGHTDKKGDEQRNWEISEKRAIAVDYYLINTIGMSWKCVIREGFGETKLVATEDNEEAHAKNRRVELYVSYE
jgi:outer membrane protein OmpA-like peptidoglycan-associated protein